MKIVIPGGAGAMARACIEDILKQKDVSQVVLCDIDEEAAKKTVADLGDKRLLARGQIKEKGVFPPEFVPHELYFEECTKRGLETEVSRKWLL